MKTQSSVSMQQTITLSCMTPTLYIIRIWLLWLLIPILLALCLYGASQYDSLITGWLYVKTGEAYSRIWVWLAVPVLPFLIWFVLLSKYFYFADDLFPIKRSKTITFTDDNVIFSRAGRRLSLDHGQPSSFVLADHPWADKEADSKDFKILKARVSQSPTKPRRAYRYSKMLQFLHNGVPYNIVAVFGPAKAAALQARLNAKLSAFKARSGGSGIAANTNEQWSDQAGSLPGSEY